MNKFFVVFVGLLAATNAIPYYDNKLNEEWQAYKLQHSKDYTSDMEEQSRMIIFMQNKNKIAMHNQLYENGQVTYEMGLNKYADLLHHEFIQHMNGYNRPTLREIFFKSLREIRQQIDTPSNFIESANFELPEGVDWRELGAVTEVKEQGHCGSCWSFSATGALEGQHFRKTKVLVSLSEQNLVDCSAKYGNHGCHGGLMDQAFQYIKDNGGIDTERSYKYHGQNKTCKYDPKNSAATVTGFVNIPLGDEEKLTAALATVGPVSVAIDASHESLRFYRSGIYYEPKCNTYKLDHGVLAVGYGTDENNNDYYIVKNSWGTSWGDGGFVKMARNRGNHCGIATSASFPLV